VSERLVPGTRVSVIRRLEFDGSVEVRIGRRRLMLNVELARSVRVKTQGGGRA